jgi:hypothetical protein
LLLVKKENKQRKRKWKHIKTDKWTETKRERRWKINMLIRWGWRQLFVNLEGSILWCRNSYHHHYETSIMFCPELSDFIWHLRTSLTLFNPLPLDMLVEGSCHIWETIIIPVCIERRVLLRIMSLNMLASSYKQAQNMILNTFCSVVYVNHKLIVEVADYVGFVADKVALRRYFSEYFAFPCQFLFYQMLHIH